MPLQNRVWPTGEIVAHPARGLFTGNRGVLHGAEKRLGRARWRHKAWIICTLEYKGTRREVMAPGRWTELFFLDEAVALAAGHRPCALCRRAAFRAFAEAIALPRAPQIDAALHEARVTRDRRQITHRAEAEALPDGAFVLHRDAPHLVVGASLLPWAPGGYGAPVARPGGTLTVVTPAPSIAALAAGYAPVLHPSAGITRSSRPS